MVLFLDNTATFIQAKQYISFDYSKKDFEEGGGKVEVAGDFISDAELSTACFLILYKDKEYITSGYITSCAKTKLGFSIAFKTLECLLKNHKVPYTLPYYSEISLKDCIQDLFFPFRSVPFVSKMRFVSSSKGFRLKRLYNMSINKIKDGDLHLSFNKVDAENNVYDFVNKGYAIFIFDRESPQYIYNDGKDGHNYYPAMYLRYSADEGSKTRIRWKIIGRWDRSYSFESEESLLEKFSNVPYLSFRRDIKDFEKNIGAGFEGYYKYIALMMEAEYINPDYLIDSVTSEIKTKNNYNEVVTVKRTVRGFTPVFHGLEIIDRLALPPFHNRDKDPFCYTNFYGDFNIVFNLEKNNIKFDGSTLFEALQKLKKLHDFNMSIDLRIKDSNKKYKLCVFFFNKKGLNETPYYNKDLTNNSDYFLYYNYNNRTPFASNVNVKRLQQEKPKSIILYCDGNGDGFDCISCTLYVMYGRDRYLGQIFITEGLPIKKTVLDELGVKSVNKGFLIDLRKTPFKQDYFKNGNITSLEELVEHGVAHLRQLMDKEVKKTFEVETIKDIRLYDYVKILDSREQNVFNLPVIEEKISFKNNNLTRTLGIGGTIFNPFNLLLENKEKPTIVEHPKKVVDLVITAIGGQFQIKWEPSGVYEYFLITVLRCDSKPQEGFDEEIEKAFYNEENPKTYYGINYTTTERFFILDNVNEGVLYSISVTSCIGTLKSESVGVDFCKVNMKAPPARMLSSLEEAGQEGDVGFYVDRDERKAFHFEDINSSDGINKTDLEYFMFNASFNRWCLVYSAFGFYYVYESKKWRWLECKQPTDILAYFRLDDNDNKIIKARENYYKYLYRRKGDINQVFFKFQEARESLYKLLFEYKFENWEKIGLGYSPYSLPVNSKQQKHSKTSRNGESVDNSILQPAPGNHIEVPHNPIIRPGDPKPIQPIYPNPPIHEPIITPINPSPLPPVNEEPSHDPRKDPPIDIQVSYDIFMSLYFELTDEVPYWLREIYNHQCTNPPHQIKSERLKGVEENDLPTINFNIPFFKNEKIPILAPNPTNIVIKRFIYNALNAGALNALYGQDEGEPAPFYKIDILKKINKPITGPIVNDHKIWEFTFCINFCFNDENDLVEIWNIYGFLVGYLKKQQDGIFLHIASIKIDENGQPSYDDFIVLKKTYPFPEDLTPYHINLIAAVRVERYTDLSTIQYGGKTQYSYSITLDKVVIGLKPINTKGVKDIFDIVRLIDYEETKSKHYTKYSTKYGALETIYKSLSFFNHPNTPPPNWSNQSFNKSRYNVGIESILIFHHLITFGEILFFRNLFEKNQYISLPKRKGFFMDTPEEKEGVEVNTSETAEGLTYGNYLGLCIKAVDKGKNTIRVVGNDKEISVENGSYFLMGISTVSFKAGVIYKWIRGDGWKELTPYSEYPVEYSEAIDDIKKLTHIINGAVFKEFVGADFSLNSTVFAKEIMSDSLKVRKSIQLFNLPSVDPQIEGALFKDRENRIVVSKGDGTTNRTYNQTYNNKSKTVLLQKKKSKKKKNKK